MMIKGGRRLATIALAVLGFVAGAAGAAWAGASAGAGTAPSGAESGSGTPRGINVLPGGAWTEQSAANGSSTVYQKGTFQGYREDQNRGSRLQAAVQFKEVGSKSDIRGAFAEVQWWSHSNNCYITSYSSPGISCSTGWWLSGSPVQTDRTVSDSYVSWDMWWNLDPAGSSGRGQFKGCLDVAFGFDTCTASVLRGSDY
jgi:hypothetical protein